MSKTDILEFINRTSVCYLATVEGDVPHVRGMRIFQADEGGIIFQSWKKKDIYQQLRKNPRVELCFNDIKRHIQVRVNGEVEPVEDAELINNIVAKRPYLKEWMGERGWGYDSLYMFILKHGKANVWTRETNFALKQYVQL